MVVACGIPSSWTDNDNLTRCAGRRASDMDVSGGCDECDEHSGENGRVVPSSWLCDGDLAGCTVRLIFGRHMHRERDECGGYLSEHTERSE